MKKLYFFLITSLLLFHSKAQISIYKENVSPGLPQAVNTGMCFVNIDSDPDLELVYSFIENNEEKTRVYQTTNGKIKATSYFEVKDRFLTNIKAVSFTPNTTQIIAIEPFYGIDDDNQSLTKYKFSIFEIEVDELNNILGMEEIHTSFSNNFFEKITYDVFDFNADGHLDIFFIGEGEGNFDEDQSKEKPTVIEVLINETNYVFNNLPLQVPQYKNPTIAHYDFNQDGFQDLYLSGKINDNTQGNLFENHDGEYIKPFSIDDPIPAVEEGQVIIQRFNKNELPDMYIRGIGKDDAKIAKIIEFVPDTIKQGNVITDTTYKIKELYTVDYFENGFAEIYDFNNDGFFDILQSGLFNNAVTKTFINYQNASGLDKDASSLKEDLKALYFSTIAIGDLDQNGSLEIMLSGLFQDENNEFVPRTSLYSFDTNKPTPLNTAPFFDDPTDYIYTEVIDNTILFEWDDANDDKTPEGLFFYELHLFDENGEEILATSSTTEGNRYFSSRGLTQDNFLILDNIPKGNYFAAIQAIDNGLMASKITNNHYVPFEIKTSLPKQLFKTFEIVQFRGENFESKVQIVDISSDGLKDFLLINKTGSLSALEQKEINVFNENLSFNNKNVHFELGDYASKNLETTLDGYLDIWFLEQEEGDEENELYIYDVQRDLTISTGITNLSSFVLCDFDNDFDLDIIAESFSKLGTIYYENVDGNFRQDIFSHTEFLQPSGIYDFNGDSYLDFYYIKENDKNEKGVFLAKNNFAKVQDSISQKSLFEIQAVTVGQGIGDDDILSNNFKVINGFDHGTDGDWDILVQENATGKYKVIEKVIDKVNKTSKWVINTDQLEDTDSTTQVQFGDQNGDFEQEAWRFNLETITINIDGEDKIYETGIHNPADVDGATEAQINTWGNTEGQQPLQWIKVVDLDADGRDDLLAHVIVSNRPKTYLFVNQNDSTEENVSTPKDLKVTPTIGSAKLEWDWDQPTEGQQAEFLLKITRTTIQDQEIVIDTLNFDGIHENENQLSSQVPHSNYMGSVDSMFINNLLEGDYEWQVAARINNKFSQWSPKSTFRINNFLKKKDIPPFKDLEARTTHGTGVFSEAADFNNDGLLDFILINNKNEKQAANYLYKNLGEGKFDTTAIDLPIYGYADIKIINYNKDAYPDIMVSGIDTSWKVPSTIIFQNDKNNNFEKVVTLPAVALGSMDCADIDNDGDKDYLLTGKNADGKYQNYFIKDTSAFLVQTPAFKIINFKIDGSVSSKIHAKFVEIDNDGLTDIFFSVYTPNENYLMSKKNSELYDSTGTFIQNIIITNKGIKEKTSSYEFIYTDFGTFDDDNYLDLVVVGLTPNFTNITNTDNNPFAREKHYYTDTTDVISANDKLRWTVVFHQNAEYGFSSEEFTMDVDLKYSRVQGIHSWDFNNDGYLDLFVQQAGRIVFIEQSEDDRDFKESSQYHVREDFSYSTFGDYTNDTRLDIIVGSLENDYILFQNNVSNENKQPISPVLDEDTDIDHPTFESGDGETIEDGTAVTISWDEPNGIDETDGDYMRYRVLVVYDSTSKQSLLNDGPNLSFYDYTTHLDFINLRNLEDGQYYIKVFSVDEGFGISQDTSEFLSFNINMDPKITIDTTICQNSVSTFKITPTRQEYKWTIIKKGKEDNPDKLETGYLQDSITTTFEDTSKFVNQKIIVFNKNFLSKIDTFNVIVSPQPTAEFEIGGSVSVGAQIDFTNKSSVKTEDGEDDEKTKYVWSVENSIISEEFEPSYTFLNKGAQDVSLKVVNGKSCSDTTTQRINVNNDVIINTSMIITQNDDGKNDFLFIQYLDRYVLDESAENTSNLVGNTVTIFNEWGQEIMVIDNYQNNWDTHEQTSGQKLALGNYFIIINVTIDNEVQTFKSTFSVLK